jgi:outer membrane protein OmpA-like peptidoglycan-associated protein
MTASRYSLIVATGLVLALGLPTAHAADSTTSGYWDAKGDSVWKTGSGDCLRTRYQDSTDFREDCGYELVVEKAAVVETTPTGTAVTVGGAAGVVRKGEVVARSGVVIQQVVINNVQFAFDSYELTPNFRTALDNASDALKPHRPLLREGLAQLNVIGHTDSKGSAAYNQRLSERRAQAVADHLIKQDPTREAFIKVMGRGEEEPLASNDTEEGRAQNRRVVLQVIGK